MWIFPPLRQARQRRPPARGRPRADSQRIRAARRGVRAGLMLERDVACRGPSERLRSLTVVDGQAAAAVPPQAAPGDVLSDSELDRDSERGEPQTGADIPREGPQDRCVNAR
jgi:hypothetical protein